MFLLLAIISHSGITCILYEVSAHVKFYDLSLKMLSLCTDLKANNDLSTG